VLVRSGPVPVGGNHIGVVAIGLVGVDLTSQSCNRPEERQRILVERHAFELELVHGAIAGREVP
jgi:hypothetical protein